MGKRYKSVSEMVRRLSEDTDFVEAFEREVADKTLAKCLFAMRCAKGLTQKEMAARLGCTQGRVSKLENARVDAIRVSDLVAYAQALGLTMSISFHKEVTAAESVKYHAFQIKNLLDHLAELAHRDDEIFEGVKGFYAEYLVNILRLFEQSADKLPKKRAPKSPVLRVCAPTHEIDEEALLAR
jgi:transcriptional regulator with XRE-family HTH domain